MNIKELENKWREEFEELQVKYKNNLERTHNGYLDGDINSRWLMYESARKKAQEEGKEAALLMYIPLLGEYEDQIEAQKKMIKERDELIRQAFRLIGVDGNFTIGLDEINTWVEKAKKLVGEK